MAKYYNADTLLEFVKNNTPTIDGQTTLQCVERAIKEAPAADAKEVKRGKWYRHNKKEHGDTCYYCSACEKMALSDCLEWELTEFCPRCGAKMDGGNDGKSI